MVYRWYALLNIKLLLLTIVITSSCTTTGPAGIFGKKSPHEQYGDKLKNAGLQETALGKLWFLVAAQSLASPLSISLPYTETGYFAAEEPKAAGLLFQGKRGEKININISKKPLAGFAIYLDLWQAAALNETQPKLLLSADTTNATIAWDVDKDGSYILRIQPELLKSGEYTLSVTTGPSLAFPVSPGVKSSIGSFWGAGRDRGARKHEGIDIFAPKRVALVAAANGTITSVTENSLGGKVIFLRPDNKDYTLYYAHLDEQLVQSGRTVKTGDTIGLVGNTGNARTTVPHLHFGIYTNSGAIDPLPFVKNVTKKPEKISVAVSNIGNWLRANKATKIYSQPLASAAAAILLDKNALLKADAATAGWYKVSLPGGEKGFVAGSAVSPANSSLREIFVKNTLPLFDQPIDSAARKSILKKGDLINILGNYKEFYYVKEGSQRKGWVSKKFFVSN